MSVFDEKAINNLVGRRHPDFHTHIEHWKFCEQSFRGGRDYITCGKNIFRFHKEGEGSFKDRLSRTYRANHTKRVVETVNQFLFKQRPQRDPSAPAVLRSFWKKATKRGDTMDSLSKQIDTWLSVFGIVYVVVDRPNQDDERLGSEKLPYSYIVFPTHVYDVAYDDDGEISWILIAEDRRKSSSPFEKDGGYNVRLRLWTRDSWFLFEQADGDKYKMSDYGDHNLGRVPVVAISENEGSRYAPPALIGDIAYLDRTLVNYGSLLDEIAYQQTYSQLVMPVEGVLPGTKAANQIMALAQKNVFLYASGGSGGDNRPSFISPDASQAALILSAMEKLKQEIYASTGTDAGDANSSSMSKGREYASGKVRMMDHSSVENMLLNKAQHLERAEDDIARLVLMWMGADDLVEIDPNWVRYPTKFDVRGLIHDIEIASNLIDMAAPTVMVREHLKSLAEKLYPRASEAEMVELLKSIEVWEPDLVTKNGFEDRRVKVEEEKVNIERENAQRAAEIADASVETDAAVQQENADNNATV